MTRRAEGGCVMNDTHGVWFGLMSERVAGHVWNIFSTIKRRETIHTPYLNKTWK